MKKSCKALTKMVYFNACQTCFLTRIRLDFVMNPKAPRSEPEGLTK